MLRTALLAVLVAAPAANATEPVKELLPPAFKKLTQGLWEGTIELELDTPALDRTKMDLSKLPPDARARVEATLKKQEDERAARGNAPRIIKKTKKFCVNDAWLARQDAVSEEGPPGACTSSLVAHTDSRSEVKTECKTPEGQATTLTTIETKSPTEYAGTRNSTGRFGERDSKSMSTFAAHWVAASCGAVK
jgi:hypothetical protein